MVYALFDSTSSWVRLFMAGWKVVKNVLQVQSAQIASLSQWRSVSVRRKLLPANEQVLYFDTESKLCYSLLRLRAFSIKRFNLGKSINCIVFTAGQTYGKYDKSSKEH